MFDRFNKKMVKLGREIKRWGVWQSFREVLDQFRSTLPLIMDLKNKAMRGRHWASLKDHISKNFDPEADDFNLEKVYALGLHMFSDFIGELDFIARLGHPSIVRQCGWSEWSRGLSVLRDAWGWCC